MLTSLHKQATATPRIRAALQASDEPAWVLADRYGISEQTVWKWRGRDSVHDRSQTPHRLRTMLLLPRDDLLAVVRAFLNQQVSRSGLDRCLRRHGVSQLQNLKPKAPKTAPEPFKAYAPGYLHVDVDVKYLPQMADEKRRVRAGCAAGSAATVRAHLVVAVDHATRWVSVRIFPAKMAANARRFLHDLERAPPMRPETNGMVERFSARIEDVLQSHRFPSGEELAQTVLRYVHPYNSQFPQSVLKGQTPIDALEDWYRQKPDLLKKRPHNHTGSDTCAQSAPPVLLSLPSERP